MVENTQDSRQRCFSWPGPVTKTVPRNPVVARLNNGHKKRSDSRQAHGEAIQVPIGSTALKSSHKLNAHSTYAIF